MTNAIRSRGMHSGMNITPHFTMAELTQSQIAARTGIDNSPDEKAAANLLRVAEALELVRSMLGRPVLVSSGYRSPALNARTPGSAKNSAHMTGRAVDFTVPAYGPPLLVAQAIAKSPMMAGIDQLIYEFGAWVHLALPFKDEPPRRELWTITRSSNGYQRGLLSLE